MEDIAVRNIRMENVQCPLYILLNRRNQAGIPYSELITRLIEQAIEAEQE